MTRMLITHNLGDGALNDALALQAVLSVVNMGKISGDKNIYCYVTRLNILSESISVYADLTRTGSHTFRVTRDKP